MSGEMPASQPPGSWEWAVCGASVTGSEHQRRGLGCDDAYSYGVAGDFIVAAVADGAGSVTGTSALGSYAACQRVLADAMKRRFINEYHGAAVAEREAMMRRLFERAAEHVRLEADALGMDTALLSTTLCVAIADRQGATFGQIGDGIIATESDDQATTLLVEAKDEYANATWFIQSDGAFETAYRSATHLGPTAFALSTDGMSYKITNVATGEAYQPFFRGSWEHVRSGVSSANFTALLRGIEDDQTGDDKTMVLAALQWQDDQFHPSARPDQQLRVSSAQPPLPTVRNVAPHDDSSQMELEPASADWAIAIPAIDETDAATPSEAVTDELPSSSRGGRRRLIRRRPT